MMNKTAGDPAHRPPDQIRDALDRPLLPALINRKDGREYLDCYSMHRMTNDSHVRWYADGETETLPAIGWSYGIPEGATKEEKDALRDTFFAQNQAIEKLLEEKGFVMTDQAHPSAQVDRYFRTRPDAGDEC